MGKMTYKVRAKHAPEGGDWDKALTSVGPFRPFGVISWTISSIYLRAIYHPPSSGIPSQTITKVSTAQSKSSMHLVTRFHADLPHNNTDLVLS